MCQFLLYKKVNQLYVYIYPISPPSCVSLPPLLSHPSRWSQSIKLISLCYAAASHQLFYIWQCIYFSATLSLRPSLPSPHSTPLLKSILQCVFILSCPQVHQNHFFLRFHVCVSMQYFFFLTDFTLYDKHQVHPPQITQISFHFMAEQNSIVYMCHIFFIHSSVDGYLRCLYVF